MRTELIQLIPGKPHIHMDRAKRLIELGRLEEAQNNREGEGAPLANHPPRRLLLTRIAAQ
jgi:hypothetical protein